ncbi:MAG TPA: D-alanyl-D-alanine carboxypeptidase family protein [Kiloniellaceae bacterium]|nr:D-alanyl-D-alanine carboxypeptidase family protein [Kiloniellaceae bacterium]
MTATSSLRRLVPALCLGLLAVFTGAVAPALAIETPAREAILIDYDTGAVLMEKDADVSMPPASMSKIMTVFMVFEQLKEGRLQLDTKLPVSENAWRMGGSKMFVEVGSDIRVEDLLRGVVIQSGNDACVVLAEGLAGSEPAFAQAMSDRAKEIGLTNSHFANATGWPDPGQRMTARDLAILARRVIHDFPDYYHFFGETEFTWSDIRQGNRNPLLYKSIGADGLKTGHTEEAGYGLVASAVQDGRRLILVVSGLDSVKARAEESARLLTWGFRQFDNYELAKAGETVETAEVWMGQSKTVPLVAAEDVVVTMQRASRKDMEVKVVYEGPLEAPIAAGSEIARLTVSAPEMESVSVPLQAGADVPRLGPFGRIFANLKHMIFGTI